MLRKLIVAVVVPSLVGCHSMQVIDSPGVPATQSRLHVGDQVGVLTKTQRHYDLKVTSIEAERFIGRDRADKAWSVRYDQIEQLQVEQFDGLRTTGLVVGILVAVYAAALLLFKQALEDADFAPDN